MNDPLRQHDKALFWGLMHGPKPSAIQQNYIFDEY